MVDNFNRNIDYARISVTDLCNLRCKYCMPVGGVPKKDHDQILRVEEILIIAEALAKLGVTKIRLTGGEPLVRKGILEIVEGIRKIDNIKHLAMTTNGVYLEKYAKDLKDAGLDSINVSLDTLNKDKYAEITNGGDVTDVLKGIDAAFDAGFERIKINTVLINGFNDDEICDLVNLSKDREIDVRFIELMPMGDMYSWAQDKFLSLGYISQKLPDLALEEANDPSSAATYYRLPNAKGRVGVIRPISCSFCGACNRIRITADAKLKPCLHSDIEFDLKESLSDLSALKARILEGVKHKPMEHAMGKGKYIKRNMVRIGG